MTRVEAGVPSGSITEEGVDVPLFMSKPRKVFAVQHDGSFDSAKRIAGIVEANGGHAELVRLMAYREPQLRVKVKDPNHYAHKPFPHHVWVEDGCWVLRDEHDHDCWEVLTDEDFKAKFFKVVQ